MEQLVPDKIKKPRRKKAEVTVGTTPLNLTNPRNPSEQVVIQLVDVKGKFLVITADGFDPEALRAIQAQLKTAGCLGVMCFPEGAKVDTKTKADLQRQIESL